MSSACIYRHFFWVSSCVTCHKTQISLNVLLNEAHKSLTAPLFFFFSSINLSVYFPVQPNVIEADVLSNWVWYVIAILKPVCQRDSGASSINSRTHTYQSQTTTCVLTHVSTPILLLMSSSDMPKHRDSKRNRIIKLLQENTDGKNNSHSCAIWSLIFLAGEQIGTDPLSHCSSLENGIVWEKCCFTALISAGGIEI